MTNQPFTIQPQWNPFGAIPELPEADVGMQWNSIVDFWMDPCEAPLDVYIKTALPFLGAAILVLLTPDVEDIIETYVEPRQFSDCGKKRRPDRKRNRVGFQSKNGLPFRIGIPDVDELIANLLPGRNFFEGRKHGPEEWLFWRLFNVVELIGYRLMILDLVGRSLYGWHSALLATEWCQETSAQVAKIIGGVWVLNPTVTFVTVPQIGEKIARNGGIAGLSGIQMTRNNWRSIVACSLQANGTEPATCEFQVIFDWGSGSGAIITYVGTVPFDHPLEFSAARRMYRPGQIYFQIRVITGGVRVETVNLWGVQQ